MTAPSVERRERQQARARENQSRHGPTFWVSVVTAVAASAVMGALAASIGRNDPVVVVAVGGAVALGCAIAARIEEARTRRGTRTWSTLVGLAYGFVGAVGIGLGDDFGAAMLVAVAGTLIVTVVIGKANPDAKSQRPKSTESTVARDRLAWIESVSEERGGTPF